MTERIGLIGLGLVGTAIAGRLSADRFDVAGFDIDPARCEHIDKLGLKTLGAPAQAARAAERIVLSLPDSQAVLNVVEGPAGLLEAENPPKYIIDTTTGDPEQTEALAQRLAERRIHFLDATISGSSLQVRERKAILMVGGDKGAFDNCRDILEALAEKIFYLGPSGSGSRAKLASNLVLGLNRLALAEGLVFAADLGLEPAAFLELLKATPARSAVMDTKGPKMLGRDFEPQARLRQHHKDVAIILKYARKAGRELPLSRLHLDILEKAIAAGDGDMDNSAVIREIERRRWP